MNGLQYEICLHHLTADHHAEWQATPVRLDVYADGEPQDNLTKLNGDCDVWDLSDTCYRFHNRIQFDLIEDDGPDAGRRLATFIVEASPTSSGGALCQDEDTGYILSYTVCGVPVFIEVAA
jgi:hypothetical protein